MCWSDICQQILTVSSQCCILFLLIVLFLFCFLPCLRDRLKSCLNCRAFLYALSLLKAWRWILSCVPVTHPLFHLCVCVCVCVWERERERVCVCVCVFTTERDVLIFYWLQLTSPQDKRARNIFIHHAQQLLFRAVCAALCTNHVVPSTTTKDISMCKMLCFAFRDLHI